MNDFIKQATPLCLSILLSLVGVTAVLISESGSILAVGEYKRRKSLAVYHLLSSIPQNLCLAAFSYDIWVVTTLLSADSKTIDAYNLPQKGDSILLLIVVHIVGYMFVLGWGAVVRPLPSATPPPSGGGSPAVSSELEKKTVTVELVVSCLAILACILFQAY